jgi:uncharacterized protein YbjT (DUF2867 family)
MKILVTGGTGTVGANVLKQLVLSSVMKRQQTSWARFFPRLPDADFITGQTLTVDGGSHMN